MDIMAFAIAVLVFGLMNEFNFDAVLKRILIWLPIYYFINTYMLRYRKAKSEIEK